MPSFFRSLFLHAQLFVVLAIALVLTLAYIDIYFSYDPSASHFGQLLSTAVLEILRDVRHHETAIVGVGLFLCLHTRYFVGFDSLMIKDVICCFSWLFLMVASFAASTNLWTFSAYHGIILRLLLSVITDISSLNSWYRAFQYCYVTRGHESVNSLPPPPFARKLSEKFVRLLDDSKCPKQNDMALDDYDQDISLGLEKLTLGAESPMLRRCLGPFGAATGNEADLSSRKPLTSRHKDAGALLNPAAFVYNSSGRKQ